MANDQSDFAEKLRHDINEAINEIHSKPQHYNSYEEAAVVVLNAVMDFHQEYAAFFRTDVEGMAKMVREAREKMQLEEKAGRYDADRHPEPSNPAPDIKDIDDELQILEYIELNKRPLTEWERNRQKELNTDRAAIEDMGAKLHARYLHERAELEKEHQRETSEWGQSGDRHLRQFQERVEQKLNFENERKRHVREYYGAKQITKDMEETDRKQALDLDQDPKLSR